MIAAAARIRGPFLRLSVALHIVGLAVVFVVPGRWGWVAGCLFVDHLIALVGSMLPRSGWVGPNIRRVPIERGTADPPFVVLTIDDGPDPDVTPQVLEILAEHRAPATFFCIGQQIERHPQLARRIVEQGHRIENHTYRHAYWFSFLTPWGLSREMGRAQDAIAACTGRAPVYFRPPAGIRNPWLDWVLAGSGLELVSWTRRALDTVDRDPRNILRRLLDDLAPGDILALHDATSIHGENGKPVVLDFLPRLLAELERREYRVSHLPSQTAPDAAAVSPVSV